MKKEVLITPFIYNDYFFIDVFKKDLDILEKFGEEDVKDIFLKTGLTFFNIADIEMPPIALEEITTLGYDTSYPTEHTIMLVGAGGTFTRTTREKKDYIKIVEALQKCTEKTVLVDEQPLEIIKTTKYKKTLDRKIVAYKCGNHVGTIKIGLKKEIECRAYRNDNCLFSKNECIQYDPVSEIYYIIPDFDILDYRKKNTQIIIDNVIMGFEELCKLTEQEIQARLNEAKMKLLFSFIDQYIINKRKAIVKENEEFNKEIVSAGALLINRSRRLMLNRTIFESISKKSNQQHLEEELALLKKDPRILKVEFEERIMCFYTDYIIAADIKGQLYDVGKLKIDVNMENGRILMYNLTHKKLYATAPHVLGGNLPCWGTAGSTIAESIAKFNLCDTVETCLNFLEVVNINDSAGQNAETHWPKYKKKEEIA